MQPIYGIMLILFLPLFNTATTYYYGIYNFVTAVSSSKCEKVVCTAIDTLGCWNKTYLNFNVFNY